MQSKLLKGCLNFTLLIIIWIGGLSYCAYAQPLDEIGKAKPLKVNGGISIAQTAYHVFGASSRREPYTYYLSGNLNMSLFGVAIPLSVNYSNRKTSFQQPFNQYGLSPVYKWVTLHVGYRSMTFSPYTLNGHTFLGAGLELAPKGIFRLSAMYGRLQKAVRADTTNGQQIQPAFERWGYGIKVGLVKDSDYGHLILFKAHDVLNSVPLIPEESQIRPQENFVIGFSGKKNLLKNIALTVDWATSAITRDIRASSSEEGSNTVFKSIGGLYSFRTSSSIYQALKTSVNYSGGSYKIGLNYERIDPEYQTLGSYYFNNDLENITVSSAIKAGKVSFSTNVGVQRNDLDNTKASNMNRIVASVNASVAPTERLQTTISFSNFRSYTRLRPKFEDYTGTPQQASDTITSQYTQISQTANATATYRVGNKKNAISTIFTLTSTSDQQDTVQNTNNLYYTTTTYNFLLPAFQVSANTGINVSWADEPSGTRLAIGPTLQANKEFFQKKLRSSMAISYNTVIQNSTPGGGIMNIRLTATYRVKKKHNINFSLINVYRTDRVTAKVISELTGNLNYGYSF